MNPGKLVADPTSTGHAASDWREQVFAAFEQAGVELFCYLHDAGLDAFISRANAGNQDRAVVLTTEEKGVGICCGAWLGGKRAVLMIQSSGVGNCINTFSLVIGLDALYPNFCNNFNRSRG
jgi:sulfopyruvate decarboxylase TPP-binding subunit